jgi:hypothetical protein
MGLTLARVSFDRWIHEQTDTRQEEDKFLQAIARHIGGAVPVEDWIVPADDSVRVGSYGAYAVLVDCVNWLVSGTIGYEPEDDYDVQMLTAFRKELKSQVELSASHHILDVGDSDTLFIPIGFARPLEYEERWVGSLPGAVAALQQFCDVMKFDPKSGPEEEVLDERWLPLATARNVARTLYQFFNAKPNACVAYT